MKIEMDMWSGIAVVAIVAGLLIGYITFEMVEYNSLAWKEGYTLTTLPGTSGPEWVKK